MEDGNERGKLLKSIPDSKFARALVCIAAALIAVLIFFAAKFIVNFIFETVVKSRFSASSETVDALNAKFSGVLGIFGNTLAAAVILLIIAKLGKNPAEVLCFRSFSLASLIPCVVFGFAFNLLSDGILTLIPIPESIIEKYTEIYSFLGAGSMIPEVINVVIITPIVEEAVFRGISYGALKRGLGRPAAVILSAAIFGAAHGNVISFVYTFALGLLFACALEVSGSLFVPMIMHAAFNASSYAVTYLIAGKNSRAIGVAVIISLFTGAAAYFFAIRPYVKKSHSEEEGSINETV